MSNIATLTAAKNSAKSITFLPGSATSKVSVNVSYDRTYADMIVRGAPQTDDAPIKAFGDICSTFPKRAGGTRKVDVLIVSLPGFLMSRKFERWVAEQGLVPMDFHTMLTISETYPTLLDDWKLKKVRLVSLAPSFTYLNERRVCTVHYAPEEKTKRTLRTLEFEPLGSGWSHEHNFGFIA